MLSRNRNGPLVLLVALLLVTSSVAALYFQMYQQQVSETSRYEGELQRSLDDYNRLSSSYSISVKELNSTITLLSDALAGLNTSTTAYTEGSRELGTLWKQYVELASEAGKGPAKYSADLFVEFGNGTRLSFLDVPVKPGWNAFVATVVALNGSIEATWYPQLQEHFVTSLEGASGGQNYAWFFWVQNGTAWEVSPTGADAVQVTNGTSFAWTLCTYDASFKPTCSP